MDYRQVRQETGSILLIDDAGRIVPDTLARAGSTRPGPSWAARRRTSGVWPSCCQP